MGMLVPNGEEKAEPMICGVEPEVEPNDVVKEEEDKPCAKAYYHFNCKLATAPKAVRKEVSKIKALPHRNGKPGKLQQIAAAFCQVWVGTTQSSRTLRNWICTSHNKRRPRHTPSKSW